MDLSLEPGTRLGPYEVLEPLGSSGDRFKAMDTERNRTVTLSVLPALDDGARERIERDVRTLSSLSHPHIRPPVELLRAGSVADLIVTEYLEGETLAARLARGPIDVQEAVTIAIGIADALDHAHRNGVVHRRLAPRSIVLAAEGPTIIDFGTSPDAGGTNASGMTSMLATRTSMSGLPPVPMTVARYMAPEQFQGQAADARADIFALGTILYEMVTGRPAFDEKTDALLVAAVQSVDPEPVSRLKPKVPSTLEHVIARSIAKDPRERIQTAWDLLAQLRWIAEGGSQIGLTVPIARQQRRRHVAIWASLGTAAVIAAVGVPAGFSYLRPVLERDAVRFTVAVLPTASGVPISLSPDGRWLVGTIGGAGTRGITALSLDSVTAQTLIPEANLTQPFWSPDGRTLAFFDAGHLKRADVAGGTAQNICETPLPIAGGTWNRDGVILFSAGAVIHRVLASGGQPTAATMLDETKGETEHIGPAFLPDGRHYLYLAVGKDSAIYAGTLDSNERIRLFASDSRPVFALPGYILFNRGNVVFAQPFDAAALALTGEPLRVVDGVGTLSQGPNASPSMTRGANFTVSQTGVLAFKGAGAGAATTDEQRTLVWYDRGGSVAGDIATTGMYAGIDIARDGRRLVVHRHEGTGGDIWSFDTAQRRLQRLTFDTSQENSSPIWSPDGAKVAFASRRNNNWGIYVKLANGTGAEDLTVESPVPKVPMGWSPDGKIVLYFEGGDVWGVRTDGDTKPFSVLNSGAAEVFPQVSPDGKWLAYQSNETGRAEIYVRQFPTGPAKFQVSTDGGSFPRWRGDSGELYFYLAPNVMAAPIHVTGTSLDVGAPSSVLTLGAAPGVGTHETTYHRFAVSPDGLRFFVSQPSGGNTATGGLADRIATLSDSGGIGGAAANLTVVLNWPKLLKRN